MIAVFIVAVSEIVWFAWLTLRTGEVISERTKLRLERQAIAGEWNLINMRKEFSR